MDRLRELLETVRKRGLARGNLRGLLHVLIGRRITNAQGEVVSTGMSWRDLAAVLKRLRWDREAVRELGLDPAALPPRDRQKFWYAAIAQADVGSAQAQAGGNALTEPLQGLGYAVGPAPRPAEKKGGRKGSPPEDRPSGRKGAKESQG
jgi:hypothetical protein